MSRLAYTAIASLDGCIEDANGGFEWAFPSEQVHAFMNDLDRPIGTHLYGRRMYETMVYWETQGNDSDISRDYAEIWRAADKVVFSRTLAKASSARTRIERELTPDVVGQLKDAAGSDLAIGGAELAGQALAAGLVDEVRLVLVPVIVGGGKRALPDDIHAKLQLIESRSFDNGFVYVRYEVNP